MLIIIENKWLRMRGFFHEAEFKKNVIFGKFIYRDQI